MGYGVKCARCKEIVRVVKAKRRIAKCGLVFPLNLVKCKKCGIVVGEYDAKGRLNTWYGAKIDKI